MVSCWTALCQAAHRAAYAQRAAEVTSPPTPWGDAVVSLLPTATYPYEVLRPLLSGEIEMLVTLFLRRDLQIYYDRHLVRQPDGGVNAIDYPVEEVLTRIVARTVQARGLGHENVDAVERSRRDLRGEVEGGLGGNVNGSAPMTSPPASVPPPRTFGRVPLSSVSSPLLPPLEASTPLVVFVPGLSGGSKEPYVQYGVLSARRAGLRPVVYNPRGMGETPLTTALPMCAAATGDFEVCLRAIKDAFPEAPTFVCGWSLGANLVTRFAGEPRARELIDGAISLCNPFDLEACCEHLETPRYFTYNVGLTKGLHGALARMRDAFEVIADDRVLPEDSVGEKTSPSSSGAFSSAEEAKHLAGTAGDVAAAAEAAERQALAAGQAAAADAGTKGADRAPHPSSGAESAHSSKVAGGRFEGQDKGIGETEGAKDVREADKPNGRAATLPTQGTSQVSFFERGDEDDDEDGGGGASASSETRFRRSKSYHSFLSAEETSYYQAMDRPPFPHRQRPPNVRAAMRATNMRAFDANFTVPAFGYKDARDYYRRASSASAVARIRVPFLAVHARNDPIVFDDAVPRKALRDNPYCVLIETPSGGHVGWTCRRLGWREGEWSDDVIPEFVKAVVQVARQGIKPTDTDQQ